MRSLKLALIATFLSASAVAQTPTQPVYIRQAKTPAAAGTNGAPSAILSSINFNTGPTQTTTRLWDVSAYGSIILTLQGLTGTCLATSLTWEVAGIYGYVKFIANHGGGGTVTVLVSATGSGTFGTLTNATSPMQLQGAIWGDATCTADLYATFVPLQSTVAVEGQILAGLPHYNTQPVVIGGSSVGGASATGTIYTAQVDSAGALLVDTSGGGGVTVVAGNKSNNAAVPGATNLGTLPAVATTADPSYTNTFQVALSTDLTGRQRVRGTQTSNGAAAGADNMSTIPAIATASAPSYTEGRQVALSTDLTGTLRQNLAQVAGATVQTGNGTAAGAQRVAIASDNTAFNVTAFGSLTNNNAAPAANNLGVLPAVANAAAPSYTEGRQGLLSIDLTGQMRAVATGTASNNGAAPVASAQLGVLPVLANAAAPSWTEGRQVLASADLSGFQRVLPQADVPTVASTATSPVSVTGVCGSATTTVFTFTSTYHRVTVRNVDTEVLKCSFGTSLTVNSTTYQILLGGSSGGADSAGGDSFTSTQRYATSDTIVCCAEASTGRIAVAPTP